MPLLVDELVLEPELELPLPTVIGRSVAAIYVFLFCFSNDSSTSTWMAATIGVCRGVGGDGMGCTSTWGREADIDVESGLFRRVGL